MFKIRNRKMKTKNSTKRTLGTAGLVAGIGTILFGGLNYCGVFDNLIYAQKPTQPRQEIPVGTPIYFEDSTFARDLKRHEGVRNKVYEDTLGNRTIGVGFNLERSDARNLITSVGADYDKILNGKTSLTDAQINRLLEITAREAWTNMQRYLDGGTNYFEAEIIAANMVFNMGYPKISQFKGLKKELLKGDFPKAADEMRSSRWYNQVGNRAKELERRMRGIKSYQRN